MEKKLLANGIEQADIAIRTHIVETLLIKKKLTNWTLVKLLNYLIYSG